MKFNMFKFVRICFIFLLIVACGLGGFKLYTGYTHQEDVSTQTATTTIPPTNYDLRNYIDIGVENQYQFGICFAFASLTSIETYLALNYDEYYDFSEMHFATSLYLKDNYYSSINDALNNGGNFGHFMLYTQKDVSLVLEDEMPMSTYLNLKSSTSLSSKLISDFNNIENNFYSIAKVNDTITFPQYVGNKAQYSSTELSEFRNKVKNHIMNYGSLTAGIYTSASGFTNSTRHYKVTNDNLVTDQATINNNTNHLISIVGWDDEYDAKGTWENKGAYLCLNSWGTSFGSGGYFYVSYDDYFIESTIQGVTNATLSTTNYKISSISNNQYKTCIYTHIFSGEPTVYTANIFDTSNFVGQNITYIDSFIKGSKTKFYIKFFATHDSAVAGINTIHSLTNTSKVGDCSMYTKYQLSTSLPITNKYMVVIREIQDTTKTFSLCGNTSDNLGIEPSYYNGSGLGTFTLSEDLWDPTVTGKDLDCTLPMIFHTDKQYIEVSPFDSTIDAFSVKHIKNNATFKTKPLKLTLNNANISASDLSSIKVTKLYKNSFYDVTSNFNFALNSNTITITMIGSLSSTFGTGNYLISIPCGTTTIYRVIEVQDVVTYSIEYELDGGEAVNPTYYTSNQTRLTLSNPTKDGYTFVGWYTDGEFVNAFNPNALPYTNLKLYAKYDFAFPSILSKSSDVSITYYDGLAVNIYVNAYHYFESDINTLTYQWYMRTSSSDAFTIVEGATSNSLTLSNVAQSGYYACEISIILSDTNIVTSPITKTLSASQDSAICVNIMPYIYDMSNVKWNYDEAISYDTNTHKVELVNLPTGVTINYTNNEQSDIGIYTATASLIYDNMDGNAIANPVEDLTWEIRKAKITITISDIVATEVLDDATLSSMLSCEIVNEYLPENVVTLQDKIDYLNLEYVLQPTSQNYVKIITATTNAFDIYDINIINGEYRVVIYTLTSNNVSTTNNDGFVQNCTFTAQSSTPSDDIINQLNNINLKVVGSYNLTYSYLQNDEASVTIPVERNLLLNGLCVYMLKDGKLIKLDTTTTSEGLTFTTSEQNATYIVAQQNHSHNTNAQIVVLIAIIGLFIVLCVCAIISGIKHRKDFY